AAFFLFFYSGFLFAQNSPTDILSAHKQRLADRALYALQATAAHPGQNRIDALYSEIHISIDYENQKINGFVSSRFRSLDDSLVQVVLDLKQNMQVSSVSGAGHTFIHDVDFLLINLDRPYRQNEELTLTVHYSGRPSSEEFVYFKFDQMPPNNTPHVWTLSEPYGAKFWWPCKDLPADKIDSADIYITVPDDQLVGSNGTLVSTIDNGDGSKTFHWQEQYPIATYLISIVAGNYAHFQDYYHFGENDSLLLDYYVYPENYPQAETIFSEMSDYLDVLSYYFGPYPFLEEKYGMAQFGWGGGMEHQTLTSIGGVGENWRYVYVHELGHQWFGDAVTCASWSDIWLNEGFASYSEALFAERRGYKNFAPGFESYQAYILKQRWTMGGTIHISDTGRVANIFNRIVHDKGSWVLHMLRHMMGDEVFFDVLKSYVTDLRWRYGSVRTADFKTICEEKSGLSLETFFTQWLNSPYFPVYEYSWISRREENGGYFLQLHILQVQGGIVYQMPMDIKIVFKDGSDTTIVIQNNRRTEQYTFVFSSDALDIQLDPEQWILRETRPAKAETFTEDLKFKNIFPNPFTSTVHFILTNWNPDPAYLVIYSANGQRIKSLFYTSKAGHEWRYKWNGRNAQGQRVSSGIYFVRAVSERNHPFRAEKFILLH
ncbi:MAG TPA: T9SS type A sorting domain-containing protein, partial [Candidatus Aenigmarchaeota archaeon]|nr:T9SS type A sorting domain-containing protein [Candidatus Aenigmarchaeota archaeon]